MSKETARHVWTAVFAIIISVTLVAAKLELDNRWKPTITQPELFRRNEIDRRLRSLETEVQDIRLQAALERNRVIE